MRWVAAFSLVVCLLAGCSNGDDDSNAPSSAGNVVPVSVGESAVCRTINQLCAAITLCQPGTSNCQTVSDVLVDNGSVGLRVFSSVLSTPLTQTVDVQGRAVGECTFFADGGTTWGPVQVADVVLGGAPAVRVPIQVIQSTFGGQSSSSNPCNDEVDIDPEVASFNGILGIGIFRQDCGLVCAVNSNNTLYFSCNGGSCTGVAVPLANQVQNPVWLLPSGNNGLVITLPNVSAMGAPSVSGSLILGIGTAVNNTPPSGISVLTTDDNGFITTVYKGRTFSQSIIDSGSNGLFFPDTSLRQCAAPLDPFYCPPSAVNLSGTMIGTNGGQIVVPFQVANTDNLVQTGNAAFNNLGGDFSIFDWGLPFFFGRTVFIGIEGQSSSLGIGPYFAF
ncbi:MAG TPA: DUF3443 domain-containing protein [Nitrospira sp.]|nr:DUF3443 domain-containing protein [Nitrospira sp.]